MIKTFVYAIVNVFFVCVAFRGGVSVGETNVLYRMGHTAADEQFPGLIGIFLMAVSLLTITVVTLIAAVHEE